MPQPPRFMPQAAPAWPQPVPQRIPQAPAPRIPQPPASAWQRPPAPPTTAHMPSPPVPPTTVRGHSQSLEPRTPAAPLSLPSPEALGIAVARTPAAATALDWNAVHARLDRLGAVRFQSDRLPQGGYRVTFLLPGGAAGTQTVEGVAATQADAVQLALSRAEGRRN